MTAIRRRAWRAAPVVMLRAPALPIEAFLRLCSADAHGDVDAAALDALLNDPEIALAIRVASSSLADAIAGDPAAHARPKRRRALLAYLTRMSTRPTPFGLFAGVVRAEWGERARLELGGPPDVRRVRPDMAWLSAWSGALERDATIRATLDLQTHPAVFRRADRLFIFGNAAGPAGTAAPAQEVSIRATAVASAALSRCKDGASYGEAIDAIARGGDTTRARAAIDTLIDQGFLATSLRPPLDGDPSRALVDALRRGDSPAASEAASALSGWLDDAGAWERERGAPAIDAWRRLLASARALDPCEPCLQVDAGFRDRSASLPPIVAEEAARAVDLLWRTSVWTDGGASLREWRTRFDARWGPWREVPVLEAFDEDAGLGLPDWRLAGAHDRRDQLLVRLAGEALRTRAAAIELDEPVVAAIERASGERGAPPESVDLFCALAAERAGDVDEGRFQLVVTNNGAVCPGGRAFGRFAHLLGGEREIGVDDPSSAAVLDAELLFEASRPRSANVMIRPLTSRHAVIVSGRVTAGSLTFIPLHELAIVLRGGRLHLRWVTEGRDVRLAARHMLNVRLMPPLARALQAIGLDATTPLIGEFSWGAAAHLPCRPRLQSGRVVLRPAEWNLDRGFFARYAADRDAALTERALPRYLYAGPSEERLLIDTRSPVGSILLRDLGRRLPRGGWVTAQEALPGPEHACATGADGRRLVEIVVSLACERAATTVTDRRDAPRVAIAAHDRVKLPGSDWLYARISLSRALADDFIAGPLRDEMHDLERAARIRSWFYIRYADPAFHIRLRMTGDPQALERDVLPRLTAWARTLRERGVVGRLAFDSYEPETERYGGHAAIAIAERIFAADSRSASQLLAARRRLASLVDWDDLLVLTVDDLVAGLGLGSAARLALYRRSVDARSHAARFRERRTHLRGLLAGVAVLPPSLAAILSARRDDVSALGAQLRTLDADGALVTPFDAIVQSLIHMHCNRLRGLGDTYETQAIALAAMTLASLEAWPAARV